MKAVCFDARMALHSGIGTYIRNLLPYIHNEFPSLQVLTSQSVLENWTEIKQFSPILMKAPIYSMQEQIELSFRIPSCDLFWSPHYNIPILPIFAKKRVVTIHDVCHLAYGKSLSLFKKSYANLMLRAASKYSDHIVTVSHFSKSEMVRALKVHRNKISVIYNGVNYHLFSCPLPISQLEHARLLYQLPKKYMIFVSNLAPHKNLSRLLKAWNLVIQNNPDLHLIVVGRSKNTSDFQVCDQFPRLKSYIHHLSEVPNDHLTALYQQAEALIYPSIYEGFGLPPLEAMSMECPVIVSSAASLPEICHDAALYVDPYDEHDIAQKICTLIENPSLRQTLIKKGKQRIDQFSWEQTAKAHIEIIRQI